MIGRHAQFRLSATRVGFIGSPEEMNSDQLVRLRALLVGFGAMELHHGGRIGADVQAHTLAGQLGLWCVVHPDDASALQARDLVFGSDPAFPPSAYEACRRAIADLSGAVVVVPAVGEVPDGPAWETARRQAMVGRSVVVMGRQGEILWASAAVFGSMTVDAPSRRWGTGGARRS